MSNSNTSLPFAVVPEEADSESFFATFAGKIVAQWNIDQGLVVDVSDEVLFGNLFAPLKSAMKLLPGGQVLDSGDVSVASLILETWPAAYMELREQFTSTVPSRTVFQNVDPDQVRLSVEQIYADIGGTPEEVDKFMDGNGLLLVPAGTQIGAAGNNPTASDPAMPHRVSVQFINAEEQLINPIQLLVEVAERLSIDAAVHPVLSQLETEGWVEIFVTDKAGNALPDEPYQFYLFDNSVRSGTTDSNGRLFETNVPDGGWWIDLTNHPSLEFTA